MGAKWTRRKQLMLVRCGKPGCRCASGEGHGPYLYEFRRVGDRVETRYVPRVAQKPPRNPTPREDKVLKLTLRRPDLSKRSVAKAVGGISASGVLDVWRRHNVGTTRRARRKWASDAARPGKPAPKFVEPNTRRARPVFDEDV